MHILAHMLYMHGAERIWEMFYSDPRTANKDCVDSAGHQLKSGDTQCNFISNERISLHIKAHYAEMAHVRCRWAIDVSFLKICPAIYQLT